MNYLRSLRYHIISYYVVSLRTDAHKIHLLPILAAAAAKSLQSCPTLCNPIDGSPLGSPVPGILQARTLEWVAISFSNAWKWKVKVKPPSRARLLVTPWTAAYQAPSSLGFSRQEYWSGLPLVHCNSWGCKESDTTERLNWTDKWLFNFKSGWRNTHYILNYRAPHLFNSTPKLLSPSKKETLLRLVNMSWESTSPP